MEQSTPANQILITSWPASCSSEASASYSQSASSIIISPASEVQCESTSSAHTSSSPLREHDYIGLAEISSTASFNKTEQKLHALSDDDDEPDLQLGLGPSAAKGACGDATLAHKFGEHLKREIVKDVSICASLSMKRQDVSVVADSSVKQRTKRAFPDTVLQVIPDVGGLVGAGEDMKAGGVMFATGRVMPIVPDADTKVASIKHPQMVYWASMPHRVSSRHPELAYTAGSFGQLASGKLAKNNPDRTPPSSNFVIRNIEPVPDEAPPAKEQVVGWPPIRSYRRSAIAARSCRPVENACDVQPTIYVKVNMDGIPIGRKVDLSAYSSYEELLMALEGMFHSPHIGENARFLHARDFVLTYEDKEGDWMLVGDVPWSMFVDTVKRLRIMRGSDSNCLGSSTSKNLS